MPVGIVTSVTCHFDGVRSLMVKPSIVSRVIVGSNPTVHPKLKSGCSSVSRVLVLETRGRRGGTDHPDQIRFGYILEH